MNPREGVSRRDLLRAGAPGVLLALVAGCDLLSVEPDGQEGRGEPGGSGQKDQEAPALAEQVRAGTLPPLAERLPSNPLVVEPVDSVGRYGGTWRSWLQTAVSNVFIREVGYDGLVRWTSDWSDIIPNLAESWEISAEGREYTFHIREGVKWSDGELLTADDFVFTHDDILTDAEVSPVPASLVAPTGQAGAIEKVDDHTVRYVFPTPHGRFLQDLATPNGPELVKPAHYLMQFHKKHNDSADQLAQDEGFESWVELLLAKNDANRFQNPDSPVLNAWWVVQPVAEGTGRGIYERNPYYWKVDPEGSQLPYLDRVEYDVIGEAEVALLRTVNGELDFNYPNFNSPVATLANRPILARDRESGDYHFVEGIHSTMNQMPITLNLNHQDAELREIFQSKDFRIGLSYAINRQDLIDAVYQRQGEPWQAAPRRESVFFDEEFAKQYTEYDVARANEHLDAAGYTQRDGDGFRLRPNGDRIAFTVEVNSQFPDQIGALELIRDNWQDIGIAMDITSEDRSLFTERIRSGANLWDAAVWTGDGGFGDEILSSLWYFPFRWAIGSRWSDWYHSDGAGEEEPPAPIREQMSLYDQLRTTPDQDEQNSLFTQLLAIAKEEFWVIGTVLSVGAYGTVKDTFHNVADLMPASWNYPTPGPTRPEQYYTTA